MFLLTCAFKLAGLTVLACAAAVPDVAPYDSLAGLSRSELEHYERSIHIVGAQPLPPPITDTSSKIVADAAHPFRGRRSGDQRGPCPGLNTLASHGYLSRNGVATPAQIVTAVQEGFNMEWTFGALVTYGAFMVNGNQLTNLMSIGGKSLLTGPPPPPPALTGGLNVHGTFEGDASLTRSDDFVGNNHDLNATLYSQMTTAMDAFGGGRYNITSASEHRYNRVLDGMMRNPHFEFANPRWATGYAEAVFPMAFFSGLATPDFAIGTSRANMDSFFMHERFPKNFRRRGGAFGLDSAGDGIDAISAPHPVYPGRNNGTHVDSYAYDPDWLGGETDLLCALYRKFINITVALYPNPTGRLRTELKKNLKSFHTPVNYCVEAVPYA